MTDDQQLTRREKRIQARRQQILEAATRVFARKGFHKTTTREIAEEADVAEGTLYNYFASKDDILLGLIDRLADLQHRPATMDATLDERFDEGLNHYFNQRMQAIRDDYFIVLMVLPEILASEELRQRYWERVLAPAIAIFEDHLRKRQAQGDIRADIDLVLGSRLISGFVLGLQLMTLLNDPVAESLWSDADTSITKLIDILSRGFQAD